jgi:hypothetical protein
MSLTALLCPACAAPIRQEDVHLAAGLATCSGCGAQMNLTTRFSADEAPVQRRAPVALPKGMTFEKTLHGVQITRAWFTPAAIGLLLFCVFWDGFLVFWYFTVVKTGAPDIAKLLPIVHVLVGLLLSYFAAASFVNRTRVTVERGVLDIRHAPLPWPGPRGLGTAQIRQLFCKRHVSRSKNGLRISWQLWAVTDAETRRKLLSGLELDQALYLEQEVEKALGIQDRPLE